MTDVTIIAGDGGEPLAAPAGSYIIRLPGEATGGALAVVEYTFPPGAVGAAPHVHDGHSEHFHILDGQVTFDLDGQSTTLDVGGTVSIPRGVAHGFRNASTTWATCLFLLTPAGYENYFRDIDQALRAGQTLDADQLAALRSRYATRTL